MEKVAIIVHYPDSYTIGEERRLIGYFKLRRRHLEIEGIRVVEIDPWKWNSLLSRREKTEYLCDRISKLIELDGTVCTD